MNLQTEVDLESCEFDEELLLHKGVPFTGILIGRGRDGDSITLRAEYKDGFPQGRQLRWNDKGQLIKDHHSANGAAAGWMHEWHDDGSIKLQKYISERRAVVKITYDPEGNFEVWEQYPGALKEFPPPDASSVD